MPRSLAQEQDILKRASPKRPPRLTSRRIGIHTSTAGGVPNAAERSYRLGCNTLQIFSSSPRRWAPYELSEPQCAEMNRLRAHYDLKPLVIHTNYLINLASSNERFLQLSLDAFRGEVVRALSLCAEYLVLHPGSFRGADRGNFEQVAEVLERLDGIVPIGACLDTCHTHVAGYDIITEEGFYQTLEHLDATIGLNRVKVWHLNDAKAPRGSKLDRHQHIGKGMIGKEAFRRLLNDLRLEHAAFKRLVNDDSSHG
jgi:deoxyribonuclease-4